MNGAEYDKEISRLLVDWRHGMDDQERDKEISRLLEEGKHRTCDPGTNVMDEPVGYEYKNYKKRSEFEGLIEAQKLIKRKMQHDILEVIQEFERQTGLCVDSVSLTHADLILKTGKSTHDVRCEVVL